MTTTIAPTEHPSVEVAIRAGAVLATLTREAIHGNDQPVPIADHAAVTLLVDLGYAVQIATRTADTPATYRATRAGLIAAG